MTGAKALGTIAGGRALAAAVGAFVLLIGAGCSEGPKRACGASSDELDYVSVWVGPRLRAGVDAFRVELCQEDRCGEITFPPTPPRKSNNCIGDSVELVNEGIYVMSLRVFGPGFTWDPDTEARLDFRGLSAQGVIVLRHEESFHFHKNLSGVGECQPDPHLIHGTQAGRADLLRSHG